MSQDDSELLARILLGELDHRPAGEHDGPDDAYRQGFLDGVSAARDARELTHEQTTEWLRELIEWSRPGGAQGVPPPRPRRFARPGGG